MQNNNHTYIITAATEEAYEQLSTLFQENGYSKDPSHTPSYTPLTNARCILLRHATAEERAHLEERILANNFTEAIHIEEDFRVHD